MKKIIVLMIAGLLIISLAACGQKKTEESAPAETETQETAEKTEAEPAEAETAEAEPTEEVTAEEPAAEAATETAAETATEEIAAEEDVPLSGGWTRAESPEVTDEIKGLLEKATEGMDGAEYEPVAYIGSQVVAGTNHALLCRITPVVPDPVSHYSIVTLYEDLEGNVSILDILDSQAEGEALSGELTGAWENPETPVVTDEAKAALDKALEKMVGAEYEPVALLATQIVSGTNYSLLCEVTPVVPNAESSYVIVHVYQDLEGNAEITDTFDFALAE